MQIKPIVSALLRHKAGTLLIIIEIALTLALTSNCIYVIANDIQRMNETTGLDIDHLVIIHPQGYSADFDIRQAVTTDLNTLRNMPGVINAAPLSTTAPGTGAAERSTFYNAAHEEAEQTTVYYYQSDHSIVSTLDLNIIAGRNFRSNDVQYLSDHESNRASNILVSQALADKLYPNGNAVGKPVWQSPNGKPDTIIGIYERLPASIWDRQNREMSALYPQVIYQIGYDPDYLVHVETGMVDTLIPEIESELSKTIGRNIGNILTVKQQRQLFLSGERITSIVLTVISALLLSMTTLGIAGLAAFSVNKRREQIGIRRALGAQKSDILKFFLTENFIITGIGIVIGTVLALLGSYALSNLFNSQPIDLIYILYNIIGLWILGLLAVYGPAKRASEIDPAIATRSA